mgnify:FL=1
MPSDSGQIENPKSITDVVGPIDDRLADAIENELQLWEKVDSNLVDPFASLKELVFSGGKRLRPAFFHWAHVGAGGNPNSSKAIDIAAAIEMLHAFALAHDDVMDRSEARRGEPSIWQRFANLHKEHHWHGNSLHFGEAAAILVGDLAHVLADKLMSRSSPIVLQLWEELRLEVNIGQYLDVLSGAKGKFDHRSARKILEYKTGRYSVQRPLQLGAAVAGKYDELRKPLTDFGQPVGVVFQLRDDILGVFGNAEKTGKPTGDDLREGKPTPLIAEAFAHASEQQRSILSKIGSNDLSEKEINDIQEVVEETGAKSVIEQEIEELTDSALEILSTIRLEKNASEALSELAHFVAYRTH